MYVLNPNYLRRQFCSTMHLHLQTFQKCFRLSFTYLISEICHEKRNITYEKHGKVPTQNIAE